MSGFVSVGYFVFSLLFSLLTFVLWSRIALRYIRLSSLHPMSQTILRFTDPMVKPFQRLFKSSNTRANRYDWACLSALVVIEIVKFTLIGFLFLNIPSSVFFLLAHVVADMIIQPCNLLFYAIFIRVILSWVNPHLQNPVTEVLYLCTEPLLRIARGLLPDFSGIDFSPFIILVALKIIEMLVSASLSSPFI